MFSPWSFRSTFSGPFFWILVCAVSMRLILWVVLFGIRWTKLILIMPLRNWRKPLLASKPQWAATEATQLTAEMKDFLAPLLPQFAVEGFEVAANVHNSRGVPSAKGFHLLLVNRQTCDCASILLVQAKQVRNFVFSISSRFADGHEVRTGVNREIGFSPRNSLVDSLSVAWVREVAPVCELHRRRLEKLGREQGPRLAPAPGEEVAHFDETWQREVSRMEADGYCYLDAAAGTYRKTLKGAFLMQWKLLPRMKRWRIRLRDRKARKVWRALGMDQWMAQHAPAPAPEPGLATPAATADTAPADAAPADDAAAAAEDLSGLLRYEWQMREGQITQQPTPDGLVVRMGRQPLQSYLAGQWLNLAFIGLFLFVLGMTAVNVFAIYTLAPYLPLRSYFSPALMGWTLLSLLLLVGQVFTVLSGLRQVGGTSVIVASPRGLTFHNAPRRPRRGHIARENLRGLYVVAVAGNGFRRSYQLVALRRSGRQTLLSGPAAAPLLEVADALRDAMGIKGEDADVAPPSLEPLVTAGRSGATT